VQKTPELVEKLIKIIRAQKPTVLISENPKDYHPDHRVIGELTQECIDKAGWGILPELGDKFKTPLGLFKTGELLENARMDLVVDITAFNDKKLKAMIAYGSQLGNSSFQLTEALDTYAGFFIRKPFAESFQLINNYPIRVNALLEKLV
jgi:LmbE family N-acetylglucosaminyl deacetylase